MTIFAEWTHRLPKLVQCPENPAFLAIDCAIAAIRESAASRRKDEAEFISASGEKIRFSIPRRVAGNLGAGAGRQDESEATDPILKAGLAELIQYAYVDGRGGAAVGMKADEEQRPAACPYTRDESLDRPIAFEPAPTRGR